MRTLSALLVLTALTVSSVYADTLNCNVRAYNAVQGLTATVQQETLRLTWEGADGAELRLDLAIDQGQPVVREASIRRQGGQWSTLGTNLSPEFGVSTGRRRITNQQLSPLRWLGADITDAVIEKEKWNAF